MNIKSTIRLLLFIIPFVLYISFIFIIDPYVYFNIFHIIPAKIKHEISPVVNECLWKIVDYNRRPEKCVLLGDSRMALINVDTVKLKYNKQYYNLSYASASLNEIINSFWHISLKNSIDTILIAISFEKYNQTFIRDRVLGAISISNNPLLYFSNYNVPQASFLCIKSAFNKNEADLQQPPMTRDEFWQYQINVSGKKYYNSYKYSNSYHNDLKKISTFCKKNNIKLSFIIFPVHMDLQKLVQSYKREKEYLTFINDIKEFGDVYNFASKNEITNDRSLFNDPFHIKMDIFNKYYLPLIFDKKDFGTNPLINYYPQLN